MREYNCNNFIEKENIIFEKNVFHIVKRRVENRDMHRDGIRDKPKDGNKDER